MQERSHVKERIELQQIQLFRVVNVRKSVPLRSSYKNQSKENSVRHEKLQIAKRKSS